jgi:hypothetical protein
MPIPVRAFTVFKLAKTGRVFGSVLDIALAVPLLQKGVFPENHDPVQNEK